MTYKTCWNKDEKSDVDGNQTINLLKFFKVLASDFYSKRNLTHFLMAHQMISESMSSNYFLLSTHVNSKDVNEI